MTRIVTVGNNGQFVIPGKFAPLLGLSQGHEFARPEGCPHRLGVVSGNTSWKNPRDVQGRPFAFRGAEATTSKRQWM